MLQRAKNILHLFCWLCLASGQSEYQGLRSWYSSATISSGGGGSLLVTTEADRYNPALLSFEKNQSITLDVIRYPAQINSKHLGWVIPQKTKTYSIHYRQLDYGNFDGFDEDGYPTRPYSSNDTWLNGSMSSQAKFFHYGLSAGIFYSRLSDSKSLVFTCTLGGMILLEKEKIKIGIAFRNFGKAIRAYSKAEETLPYSGALSISKDLAYLPLSLNLDLEFIGRNRQPDISLSGKFTLTESVFLRWGINSDKFDQQIKSGVAKDLITGTGVGLGFKSEMYSIETGGYFYNPGNWLFGVSAGFYR